LCVIIKKLNKTVLLILLILSVFSLDCSKAKEDKIDWTPVPDSIKNRSTQKGEDLNKTGAINSFDDVKFTTTDKKEITGSYYYSASDKELKQPVVILIHQFNETKAQWQQPFIDSLLALKYKVLTFDLRGHGSSTKQDGDIESILTDPNQAPQDIKAAIEWLRTQKGVDTARIAAVGTSIGGNLALYGALNLNIKVPVAVSNGKSTFEAFTGYNELMMGRPYFPKIKNALLICGNKDGEHEAGQKWIMENFCSEPRELKVYDSDKHGKFLVAEFPGINTLILSWLKKYL
jgi:hypothetical protein